MTSPTNWSDDHTLAKVKRILIEAGGIRGFADAATLFRQFDLNKNGYVDENEFNVGLSSIGAKLSKQEVKYLVLAFDKDRDGRISLQEFVGELVYPQMNWRRQRIVLRAFEHLKSTDADGRIQPAEVRARFDPTQHPEVRAGRVSADLIQREFEKAFDDTLVEEDGYFNEETFKALFGGISSVVPSDDIFDEIITLGFHIDSDRHPTFADTHTDWQSTKKGEDPLEHTPHRPDDAWSKKLQQVCRNKGYDQSMRRPHPDREPKLPMLGRVWETTSRLSFANPTSVPAGAKKN